MSYSDLLAQQQKELERLNQEYYADHVTIKALQNEHYDKARYDGQLERLQQAHERKVKEMETRFAKEQRGYLNEPDAPAAETVKAEKQPDISESQDRMAATLEQRRQQRAAGETKPQEEHQGKEHAAPVKDMTDEVQRLKKQAQERRAQQKQPRRGFRR